MVYDPIDHEDMAEKLRGSGMEDHAPCCLRYGLMFESSPEVQVTRLREFAFEAG